ncbi:MAG: DoxX family protein [Phycisphaeraceae bacterium]|nr:DoxX family protein [Phycisphaeraceae bacterium]
MGKQSSDLAGSVGLLLLRVVVSGYMITHGWGKFQMVLNGKFGEFPDPLGIGNGVSLVSAAFAEFICAILVVLGVATRMACIPLIFTMCVAAFVVHSKDPWTMSKGAELFMSGAAKSWSSKQPALMFAAVYASLLLTGPGKLSVDALVWPRLRKGQAGGAT